MICLPYIHFLSIVVIVFCMIIWPQSMSFLRDDLETIIFQRQGSSHSHILDLPALGGQSHTLVYLYSSCCLYCMLHKIDCMYSNGRTVAFVPLFSMEPLGHGVLYESRHSNAVDPWMKDQLNEQRGDWWSHCVLLSHCLVHSIDHLW